MLRVQLLQSCKRRYNDIVARHFLTTEFVWFDVVGRVLSLHCCSRRTYTSELIYLYTVVVTEMSLNMQVVYVVAVIFGLMLSVKLITMGMV